MFEAYPVVKFLHAASAALFFGWAALAPFWLTQSLMTTEVARLPALRRRVTVLVVVMIGGGLGSLWVTGAVMGRVLSPDAFSLSWVRNATVLAVIAAALWLAALLPWYRRLLARRIANQAPASRALLLFRGLSLLALAFATVSLWMMVVRPI